MKQSRKNENKQNPPSESFAGKLAAAVGKAPASSASPSKSSRLNRHSTPIRGGKDLAGRAPYNFVPLPDTIVADLERPPEADRYHESDRFSGEIALHLTALTPFYIRGMWPSLEDYLSKQQPSQPTGERLPRAPFLVNGQLRLPGSSLRGMIRALVEILGKAPLDPVNNAQLFFRAVGASADKANQSFDPNAKWYRELLVEGDGTKENPTYPKAEAGYLHGSRTEWTIRPAQKGPTLEGRQTQWYRMEDDRTFNWHIKKVEFKPASMHTNHYPHRQQVFYRFGIIPPGDWHLDIQNRQGHFRGTAIRSGFIPGKYLQWIIHEEDRSSEPVVIPPKDVEDYKNDRNRNVPKEMEFSDQSEGAPCFYVRWQDRESKPHVSFGHTPYFRLPYRKTTQMANPSRRDSDHWDFGQLLFGRSHQSQGPSARGRVFFEDALQTENIRNPGVDTQVTKVVLGEPKPTTYQHYLVQNSESGRESIHWDAPNACLRGHKLYWHRPGADAAPSPDLLNKAKVLTSFYKAHEGNTFTARIRFENLSKLELGLLLTAIQLPTDCRHHLGMAKPLGFGSFHIKIADFKTISRRARYSQWFESPFGICTGIRSEKDSEALALECRKIFAEWYLGRQGLDSASFEEALWNDPRLQELKALLSWPEFSQPNDRERWLGRTRYMGFGKVMQDARWGDPRASINLNEYLKSGYPEQEPKPAARRPLPPASQVWDLKDKNVPEDKTPP